MSRSTYSRSHETGTLISIYKISQRRVASQSAEAAGDAASGILARRRVEGPRPRNVGRRGVSGGEANSERARAPSGGRTRRVVDLTRPVAAVISELLQEAQIVLIEEPDVRRAGAQHRQALDAAAPREPLVARRVVADASQDVRMDHAAAGGLDPTVTAAGVAFGIASLADHAAERDLRRRLGEREVIRPETDLTVPAEHLAREGVEDAFQVRHRELLVDGETFVLEEDALSDRVGRLVPVAPSRNDDPDRRPAPRHHAALPRCGV